jgi:hypothetical protein
MLKPDLQDERVFDISVLCFVQDHCAWFTTMPLLEQQGDDWFKRSYEKTAGEPYEEPGHVLTQVFYRSSLMTPAERLFDCPWSVKEINAGAIAWLSESHDGEPINIPAGTSLREFITTVKSAGGSVFLEPDFVMRTASLWGGRDQKREVKG